MLLLVALSVLNGIFTPFIVAFYALSPAWFPPFLPMIPSVVFYLSSLAAATLTLIVSGIPAALFERVTGARETTVASLVIWIVGAAVLSLPAIERALALL